MGGPEHTINGEQMTQAEYEDLQAAMETVQDLIERQGIPVFNNVRLALIQIGDKLIRLREAFDTLDTAKCGKLTLAEIKMAFRIHVHRDLSSHDLRAICSSHGVNAPLSDLPLDRISVTFDEFCSMVSEYKNKATDQSKAWDSVLSKSMHFISSVTVTPFMKVGAWLGNFFPARSRSYSASNLGRRGSCIRDVYLGGSQGSNWREQIAIPGLKKSGFTFYNPAAWSSTRSAPTEASAMDNSRVLLFVIQSNCRSVSAMCQAAYLIGLGCNVVLCVQHIPPDARLGGRPSLSSQSRTITGAGPTSPTSQT